MKVGFIGAGKAGCSLGKYLSLSNNVTVTGYNSLIEEEAKWAAAFTKTEMYNTSNEVVAASDSIIISTPDGAIREVWDSLDKAMIKGRIVCHLSGSLSSDVFSGIENFGGYPISIHPLFAFSDKESVYKQLNNVCFTLEGHPFAVSAWKKMLETCGNEVVTIEKEKKPLYHAAASVLSNHVVAILDTGYKMLMDCGFSDEQARQYTEMLVMKNVAHVVEDGTVAALTGPIERNDIETVRKHIASLDDDKKQLYKMCGNVLIDISKEKNSDRDYTHLQALLNE
ncbi:MAG: DUF2520 domain-containing protein [Lachnospiraceae bacterium]|jgi:predicted short-subunit dehydrogenase-like oxidoreductase (DUF2520 family)|nr:DUF2520 domain-containing protein [Lachnospiraceae bacterium]